MSFGTVDIDRVLLFCFLRTFIGEYPLKPRFELDRFVQTEQFSKTSKDKALQKTSLQVPKATNLWLGIYVGKPGNFKAV
jgi:hypothetical protein